MTGKRPGFGESFGESNSPSLKDWNYARNSPLTPNDFFPSGGAKVWWICNSGHEWVESLNNRSKGRGCPYCSGRRCIAAVNDLATVNLEIFNQIHDLAEVDCPLDEIHPGSTRVLTWRCDLGHLWQAEIRTRVKGHGCPFCAGVKVTRGVNDLASQRPDLLVEWHSSNPAPWEVAVRSNKKYTWVCQNKASHVFDMTANDRCNSKPRSCPYCAGKRVLIGDNDLGTTHPALSREWDDSNTVLSFEVSAGSRKKVVWRCETGHVFKASVAHRAKRGQGCPICSNQKVVTGVNDISTTHPELAAEVDVAARVNEGWEGISAGSARQLVWRCHNNHRWVQRAVVR